MDELALIDEARAGDLNAFNHLVLEYQDMAFNLAARMLDDADAAADVTQTAFLLGLPQSRQLSRGIFPCLGDAHGFECLL